MTAAFFIGLVVGGLIMSLAHYGINQHVDERHRNEARLRHDPPPGPALVRRGNR